jgi:hypothetical protein
MSGGHFNYAQFYISEIAERIELLIGTRSEEFPKDIVDSFKTGLAHLKIAHVYAQRIDWLVSGDDCDDSFRRRLKEDLEKIGAENKK